MTTRAAIVAEARAWLGTPFAHQAHSRCLGTDCIGLVASVGVCTGVFAADAWQRDFAQHAGYARSPANGALEQICDRYLVEVPEPQAGDVALIRFDREPQHLAIFVPYRHGGLALVHALSRAGRVVEHRYGAPWPALTVATFAYPGVSA